MNQHKDTQKMLQALRAVQAEHSETMRRGMFIARLWLSLRTFYTTLVAVWFVRGNVAGGILLSQLLSLALSIALVVLLQRGIRWLAWLPLAGGVLSLLHTLIDGREATAALLARGGTTGVYVVCMAAGTLVQIALMAWLLLSRPYKAYAEHVARVAQSFEED